MNTYAKTAPGIDLGHNVRETIPTNNEQGPMTMNYIIQNTSISGLYEAALTVGTILMPVSVLLAYLAAIFN